MASWPGCLGGIASDAGRATRKEHVALSAGRELRFVYAGWNNSGNDEPSVGPIRVKGSIEYPAGNYIPVHFPDEDTAGYVTIPPGATIASLPCDITIPAGAKFYSNTSVVPTHGSSYPIGRDYGAWAINPPDSCSLDTTIDYTFSPQPNPASSPQHGYIPLAICGTPVRQTGRAPIVGILGDSIAQGIGSTIQPITGEEVGVFQEACQRAGIGYVNLGINGYQATEMASYLLRNESLRQLLLACTDVVISLGSNDLNSLRLGRSTAPVTIRNLQTVWGILARPEVKIWQATFPPRTHTTDRLQTIQNQSPWNPNFGPEVGGGSQWSIVNNYLRGCPAPLAGIIDIAAIAAVLNDRGSYVWRPGLTRDGVHPLPRAGRPDFISLVPTSAFGA